jgi:hypothetical protein
VRGSEEGTSADKRVRESRRLPATATDDVGVCEIADLLASSLGAKWWGNGGKAREGILALFVGAEECQNGEGIGQIEDAEISVARDHRARYLGKKVGVSAGIKVGPTCQRRGERGEGTDLGKKECWAMGQFWSWAKALPHGLSTLFFLLLFLF